MMISKESLGLLVDLVENKLSCMQVSDREDMREAVMLQRCLGELQGAGIQAIGEDTLLGVPRRGRRRKMLRAG